MHELLQLISLDELGRRTRRAAVDPDTLAVAGAIIDEVRQGGEAALRLHSERLGDLEAGGPLVVGREQMARALDDLPTGQADLLRRTAQRIREFARAQRSCLQELEYPIPGGLAGHSLAPVQRAGCYAPGGRFPLPSSVLMTACTARVAGVESVWLASPRPGPLVLAAAAVAQVDGLLCAGGAQAVAALAFGAGVVPPCDAVVGPGNKYVTAAKQLVSGQVSIDMLAGPSELLVIADSTADPATVAADLLAQAEHDPDALPMLVVLDEQVLQRVEQELGKQLVDLPTAQIARQALKNGFALVAKDQEQAIQISDQLAPEHLELCLAQSDRLAGRLSNYGALFVGDSAAEVFGDYGAGPNHVLPTGTTARFSGGLSVMNFLRVRTWLRIDEPSAAAALIDDAQNLAELEGLEAHARAAARRRPGDCS